VWTPFQGVKTASEVMAALIVHAHVLSVAWRQRNEHREYAGYSEHTANLRLITLASQN